MIEISGQYGDPKADDVYWPLHKNLNDCFEKRMTGEYFKHIKILGIVFRVSGKFQDFKSEGPERMKYIKKNFEINIDLVFPELSWRDVEANTIRKHVAAEVRKSVQIMLRKADFLKEIKNIDHFRCDFEEAISDFLAN